MDGVSDFRVSTPEGYADNISSDFGKYITESRASYEELFLGYDCPTQRNVSFSASCFSISRQLVLFVKAYTYTITE